MSKEIKVGEIYYEFRFPATDEARPLYDVLPGNDDDLVFYLIPWIVSNETVSPDVYVAQKMYGDDKKVYRRTIKDLDSGCSKKDDYYICWMSENDPYLASKIIREHIRKKLARDISGLRHSLKELDKIDAATRYIEEAHTTLDDMEVF